MELPLFPGYVFCRFARCDRLPVLKTPSVLRIVGTGLAPTPNRRTRDRGFSESDAVRTRCFAPSLHTRRTTGARRQRVPLRAGRVHNGGPAQPSDSGRHSAATFRRGGTGQRLGSPDPCVHNLGKHVVQIIQKWLSSTTALGKLTLNVIAESKHT